jgi:hypothetical protein
MEDGQVRTPCREQAEDRRAPFGYDPRDTPSVVIARPGHLVPGDVHGDHTEELIVHAGHESYYRQVAWLTVYYFPATAV